MPAGEAERALGSGIGPRMLMPSTLIVGNGRLLRRLRQSNRHKEPSLPGDYRSSTYYRRRASGARRSSGTSLISRTSPRCRIVNSELRPIRLPFNKRTRSSTPVIGS